MVHEVVDLEKVTVATRFGLRQLDNIVYITIHALK